jgi:hypothetical protein
MMGKNTKFIFVKRHLVKKIVSVKNVFVKKLWPWISDIIWNLFNCTMSHGGFERKSSFGKYEKKIIFLCHSKYEKNSNIFKEISL